MMPESSPRAVDWLAKPAGWHLPVILLISLVLRLMHVGWAQGHALSNQVDSIEAYEVAVNFIIGEERAQYLGQPNCNVRSKLPGPLWTLFCVGGIDFFGSLGGISLLIVLVNVAAIGLTWRLARDLTGRAAANVAALFMAISPWSVQYSSVVWNPAVMPLIGVVIFLVLFRCQRRPNSAAIFLLPLLILAGAHFHLSTLSLLIPVVAFGWLARVKPHWGWLTAGIVAGLFCYVPYVLGDMRHDWANTRGMLAGGHQAFSPTALRVFSSPFTFLVNFWNPGWTYAPGDLDTLARRTFGGIAGLAVANVISAVFAAGTVWGAGRATRAMLRKDRATPREILARSSGLLSAVFLLLAYLGCSLLAGKAFHARYCLLVTPLLFTVVGCGTVECLRSGRGAKLFGAIVILTAAANLWFVPAMCRFERDRIAHSRVFVPAAGKLESVYRQLKSRAPGPIEIRDHAYYASLPPGEESRIYGNAMLLSRYVRARERLAQRATPNSSSPTVFELRPAAAVDPAQRGVAFYANGIALVAASD